MRKDYPDIWWVDGLSGTFNSDKVVYKIRLSFKCRVDDIPDMHNEVLERAADLIQLARCKTTAFEQLYVVQSFISSVKYDLNNEDPYIRTVYGCLVNNRCVCTGMADCMKYFCDELNIHSNVVFGFALYPGENKENECHAWNQIFVGEKWYWMDPTWNDQPFFKYFLLDDKHFLEDHLPNEKPATERCSSMESNLYMMLHRYVTGRYPLSKVFDNIMN